MSGRPRGRPRALTVGQRLALGLLPALLAVALVVGLAYWGEYGRAAPGAVVAGAAVLAVASLAVTWRNARDLTRRVAALAGAVAAVRRPADAGPGEAAGRDELDRAADVVARLQEALTAAEAARVGAERAAAAALRARAALVEAAAGATLARLDEMRLPLHILLDSRFGPLNENQEELLAAARDAGDAADAAVRRLREVAAADQGAPPAQRALVALNDVVRAVEPQVRAFAERRGRAVVVELEPGLPRAWADRAKLAEALVLLARVAVLAPGGGAIRLRTTRGSTDAAAAAGARPAAAVVLDPFPAPAPEGEAPGATPDDALALDRALAERLLEAQQVRLARAAGGLRVEFAGA